MGGSPFFRGFEGIPKSFQKVERVRVRRLRERKQRRAPVEGRILKSFFKRIESEAKTSRTMKPEKTF